MASTELSTRSPGIKLVVVGLLSLVLGIPLGLIGVLKWERMERADSVIAEVARRAGHEQTFHGPHLTVPYTYSEKVVHSSAAGSRVDAVERHGTLHISPASLDIEVKQTTQVLHRAIYQVPVQTSDVQFVAQFDGIRLPKLPAGAVINWAEARWTVGITDARGLGQLEIVPKGAAVLEFEPVGRTRGYMMLSAPAAIEGPDHRVELRGRAKVSGVGAMMFTPAGVQTKVSIGSDWPHPAFVGAFVPADRNITDDGYTAEWWISNVARAAPEVTVDSNSVDATHYGVRLLNPSDGYFQVSRSLKYGLLFVILALGAFLVVEMSSRVPVHPAQYGLVGMVQVSFYLLLLALSEHASIELAYALAGTATTLLTGMYALWTFGSARFAAAILFTTGVSYAFQYTLVQLEDHALLVGSMIVFLGLAALMYATRKVQWYRPPPLDPESQAVFNSLEIEADKPASSGES